MQRAIKRGSYSNIPRDIKGRRIEAKSPEGWEEAVEVLKEKPEIDNPFALAYWMKEQGYDKPSR